MVIDSSAMIAILRNEPEAAAFTQLILDAPDAHISAMTMLETSIVVIHRQGAANVQSLDDVVSELGIEIVPFDAEQAVIARSAFERFGRGRHPARLNFGDCAAYALAASRAEPLLFKGSDFAQTDIERAR